MFFIQFRPLAMTPPCMPVAASLMTPCHFNESQATGAVAFAFVAVDDNENYTLCVPDHPGSIVWPKHAMADRVSLVATPTTNLQQIVARPVDPADGRRIVADWRGGELWTAKVRILSAEESAMFAAGCV